MSSSVPDLAALASAAQAAYAFFEAQQSRERALTGVGTADFTSTEAARFLGISPAPGSPASAGFELRHHLPNDPSGFSASVFFDRSSNKYVLAIRGTEDFVDVLEDTNRIAVQGYAGDQAVSLYRYYRQLTTPAGRPVNYSASEVDLLTSMRLSLPVKISFTSTRESVFRSQLGRDVGLATLDGSGGSVIPSGAPLAVTGHSLGGHLALLFGRMFPGVTEHVYTYNAPGIGPIGEASLRWLGVGPIDPGRVTNVASIMGREAISLIWSKPGELVGLATEPGSLLQNHSIVPLTDTLALYGAFATLSPGLASDADSIGGIIAAASARPEDSLELTLDMLRKSLGIEAEPTRIAALLTDLPQREDYYANLYGLLDSRTAGLDYGIVPLAGKTPRELATLADSELSVRHALRDLVPFAVKQGDHSAFPDSQSAGWLSARAEMLATLNGMNQVDLPFAVSDLSLNELFDDHISGKHLAILRPSDAILARQFLGAGNEARMARFLGELAYDRTTVFAADLTGEAISGLQGDDRLFGGTGDDRLDGGGGSDLLEGGAGADQLKGGDGDDTLIGGAGADRLEGGAGDDTYVFEVALDADTIVDRDGGIYAGATRLTGGSGGEGGQYLSGDGTFTYAFSGDLASEGTLVVNGSLRVEGFRNGDLGIRLVDGLERETWIPATDADLLGDFEYVPIRVSAFEYIDFDVYGNPRPETRASAVPGRQDLDTEFPGTPGNTHFVMGGGDDYVQDKYGGDDRIELGSGDDAGFGGRGNDLIEGGPGRDLLVGGQGNDVIYAGSVDTVVADLDARALPARSDGGDLLSGNDGDDTLIGDAEANLIEGGAGRDRIFGGAGGDWIGSDLSVEVATYPYSNPNRDSPIPYIEFLWRSPQPNNFSVQAGAGVAASAVAWIGSTSFGVGNYNRVAGDADEIDAGPGNDTVAAGGGNDLIFGGSGNDYIDTGNGADTVFGGDGNDYVAAQWDAVGDYIDAGDGDDVLVGGTGDDILIGGRGNDRLVSYGGTDLLLGGEGNDFIGFFGGSALVDGGPGDDTLNVSASAGGASRVRVGRGSGFDVLEARGGPLVVEMVGDVSPQEVSVAFAEQQIPARDGGIGDFETLTGVQVSIGTDGDALFLADILPAGQQAARSIEFSDGTVWDEAYLQSLLAPADVPDDAPGDDPESPPDILPANRAPQMPALLGSVAVDPGARVEVAIPRDAISDPDPFDSLSYYAVTAEGERLPQWLAFDAAALTFSGTPGAADAGPHEILLIAADASGAASMGSLFISVGEGEAAPALETPAATPAALPALMDVPPAPPAPVPAPARREEIALATAAAPLPAGDPPKVGVPADPLFRDMQQRFDVLLQTGRSNLGERYADAVREFEERRLQREEPTLPPPPTEEEVEAWNSAMHSWHDRNSGFAETDLGRNDGAWTAGWGLPGPGDGALGGNAVAGTLPGLANPLAQARLGGAAAAPSLSEGLGAIP